MSIVRVIPLGGAGEIGKNCTVLEQGDDLIVVDVGLAFPNEEMFGVDIVIPDFTYIVENRHRLRGVFLTHAHEDHVGALPYLLRQVKAPVYSTGFTLAMIRSKLEERIDLRGIDLRTVKPGDAVACGALEVELVRVTHSMPETCSVAVRTAHGVVLFTGDFKLDFTPVDGKLTNINRFAELGKEGVLLLLSDSTNIERPGWGPSERLAGEGLRRVFTEAPGRVLITTFASNIHRLQQAITVAHETGRKVAVAGRRMEQTLDICSRMGYLTVPNATRVRLDEIDKYEDHKVVILTTGSQGEPMSALVQMSKAEYARLRVQTGDTVVYSARPIPGNEASIWRTINRLFKMGANVVYDSPIPVHVSGHAYQEELKMVINLVRPFYLAPVHGEPRHQHLYGQIAREMGYPEHRIFRLEDGLPLCMDDKAAWLGEPEPCGRVLVDNGGNPGVTEEILRDRSSLATDGIVLVTVAIDVDQGEVVSPPEIQAKGFSGPPDALQEAIDALGAELRKLAPEDIEDVDLVRSTCADVVRKVLRKRSQLRPLVVPAVLEI
jgi:ribonuclease J